MINIDSRYALFGLTPNCSDEELRRAYHRALLKNHPDMNPDNIESATIKTQLINAAYDQLKQDRTKQSTGNFERLHSEATVKGEGFTIRFSSSYNKINIEDIIKRKTDFRDAWENSRRNPTDPIYALKFIHTAFKVEKQDSIQDLLLNPILIDSASLLLSFENNEDASNTLIKWADSIYYQKPNDSIQILDDALSTGKAASTWMPKALRYYHYAWAQYNDPITNQKATPEVRIKHLLCIIELGTKYDDIKSNFHDYDYIYKCLAEAYHDLGEDDKARSYLQEAFKLNPKFSGGIKISRALGFLKAKEKVIPRKKRKKYKYSKSEYIPSENQIREWVSKKAWDLILNYADPDDYSGRILPSARKTLCLVAKILAKCPNVDRAKEALCKLLNFNYFYNVSEAAITSLSKIGDESTLDLLKAFNPEQPWRDRTHLKNCINYLQARVSYKNSNELPQELYSRAEESCSYANSYANRDYGIARYLLENLMRSIEPSHPFYFNAVILLARTCANMLDYRTSIDLTKPILFKLPEKFRNEVYEEFTSWLYYDLDFGGYNMYHPINDEDYLLALNMKIELALTSKTPGDILKNLHYLSYWLEHVGAGDTAQWIGRLIVDEVPGTWYATKYSNINNYRNFEPSQQIKQYILTIDKIVKSQVAPKLREMLKSQTNLESAKILLYNNKE